MWKLSELKERPDLKDHHNNTITNTASICDHSFRHLQNLGSSWNRPPDNKAVVSQRV